MKSLLKYLQAKHSVTLGNWMTIIIMLIDWCIYVNNLSLPLVLWICILLRIIWKVGDIGICNESEIASCNKLK